MEIQGTQILFQIINFGVVFVALSYLLYKPVLKTLDQRSKKVKDSQDAAEEVLKQKADSEKFTKKTLDQAKKEASELLSDAKKQADKKKDELMNKAKADVQKYLTEEKEKWAGEKAQMVKQLQQEVSEAVFSISEKVLGESIDKKTHTKLVDQSISDILKAI